MKLFIYALPLLLLFTTPAISQDFISLNEQFIALYQQGKYGEAIPIGIKALDQAKKEFGTSHINYAIAADNLASAYLNLEEWPKARRYYHESKAVYKAVAKTDEVIEVALCNNSIGTTFLREKRFDSSVAYYNQSYNYFHNFPDDQYENLSVVAANLCNALSMMGLDRDAEIVAESMLPVIEKKEGKTCENYYSMLTTLGVACRNQQKLQEALGYYQSAVLLAGYLYGWQHAEYASMLDLLGDCLRDAQRYPQAEDTLRKSLAIHKLQAQPDLYAQASVYHHLGNLNGDLARFDICDRYYDTAIALIEAAKMQSDMLYSTVLKSKGYTYVDAGRMLEGRRILQRVLELYKQYYGENYAGSGEVLITLGNICYQTNELANSGNYVDDGMKVVKHYFGEKNYLVSRGLEIKGLLAHKLGNSAEGLALCDEALKINRKIFGDTSQFTASTLSNKGIIYQETGDYPAAEEVFRQSLNIRQHVFKLNHPQTAIAMLNLASVMLMQSRYADADKLLAAAYEIYQSREMLGTTNGLLTINSIALLMEKQDDYESAAKLYSKALAILKTDSTENSVVYGTLLNNLSINKLNQKQYDESLRYALQAMTFTENVQGKRSISYIKSANNAIVSYSRLKQFDNGRKLGNDVIKLSSEILGDSAEILGTVYSNLSALEAQAGNLPLGIEYINRSLNIQLYNYGKNLYALSERDQVAYWQQQAYQFQLLPALVLASDKQDNNILTALINQQLRLKGFVLNNASATLHKARNIKDPELQLLLDDWQSSKTAYLQQSSMPVDKRSFSIDSLSIRANNLEQAINRKAGKDLLMKQAPVTWQQVQQALQQDEAAVEFIRYPKFSQFNYTDTVCYAAIVIRKNNAPALVALGQESAVLWCMSGGKNDSRETNITKLYRSSIKGKVNTGPTFTGDSLYKLIWKPLMPYLNGIRTVSYAPDGTMHKIAFAALPTGEGTLLLDSFQLQQYSSVRLISSRKTNGVAIKSAVLEGFADFGSTATGTPAAWSPLPGTEKEMAVLKQLFDKKQLTIKVFSGNKATEESLKALNNNAPAILHIATHGFFLPDMPLSKSPVATDVNALQGTPDQNPLMRSGIVLAGANQYWRGNQVATGKDDGIVTAYEIAQLNLQGTELVVLSACETGLGEVKDAEGVFGLQRALKMSGIRHMVLSLWEVPDEETMELMTLFYTALLEGSNTRSAFDKAQREMRAKHPPFAWAAFVLME